MNKSTTTEKQKNYISNPFSLIINGFSKLFESNQTMAIIILIFSLLGMVLNFIPGPSGETTSTSNPSDIGNEAVVLVLIIVGVVLLTVIPFIVFVSTLYRGIVAYTILQTSKDKSVTFSEALTAAFKRFWTILAIDIIVFFKILGGTLLLIVPGVRAALRYRMVHLHVFDENANASTAIQKAKALTKDHLIEVFGMVTAASIIPFVGVLMEIGGQSIMYPQLKELKASDKPKPPVHWLNYLGFILFAGLLLFIALIVAIVGLVVN